MKIPKHLLELPNDLILVIPSKLAKDLGISRKVRSYELKEIAKKQEMKKAPKPMKMEQPKDEFNI